MILDFKKLVNKVDKTPFMERDAQGIETDVQASLNKILAINLASNSTHPDIIKLRGWWEKLYEGQILDLDKSDTNTLRRLIMEFKGLAAIIKCQMIDVIDEAEQKEKASL